jgi:hypothetical protein
MAQDWVTLISLLVLAVSVGLLMAMLFVRRRPGRGEPSGETMRSPVASSVPSGQRQRSTQESVPVDGLGQRLQEVEQQLRLLAERQDQLDLRRPMAQPYRLAIKLAQGGAGVEEIVSTCGINRGEAELVAMLHRAKRA